MAAWCFIKKGRTYKREYLYEDGSIWNVNDDDAIEDLFDTEYNNKGMLDYWNVKSIDLGVAGINVVFYQPSSTTLLESGSVSLEYNGQLNMTYAGGEDFILGLIEYINSNLCDERDELKI